MLLPWHYDAKWFYINRDDDEEYIGCIKGNGIFIWNALTGVVCTVTYGTGAQTYLSGTKLNYKLLTVQDTTVVINNSQTVAALAETTPNLGTTGTIVLTGAVPSAKYYVTIQGVETSITADATDASFDDILTAKAGHNLKDAIDALVTAQQTASNADFNGTWTVTRNGDASLDISRVVSGTPTSFTIEARGGVQNTHLGAFQDEVYFILYNILVYGYFILYNILVYGYCMIYPV